MEGYLSRKLLLQKRQTSQNGGVRTREIDKKVVIVERLELYFDGGGLHDLIDLAVLLSRDKLPMFVGELHLKANFVMECLYFLAV